MPPKKKVRAPDRIVRNGLVYEMSAFSNLARILEERRTKTRLNAYPRPCRPGETPSPAQRALIDRIAACPYSLFWYGIGSGGPASPVGLHFSPRLLASSVRVLWEKGYIMAGNEEGTIRLSTRGEAMCREARVAYERIRWEALARLSEVLTAEWKAYRELGQATNWACRAYTKPPAHQATRAMIRDMMKVVHKEAP